MTQKENTEAQNQEATELEQSPELESAQTEEKEAPSFCCGSCS
ncbi:hypothetical protein [Parashewanella tropica]|nr:hypothetical protein [Parashewanella tropica]